MKRMLVVCALALMLVLPNLAAANGDVTLVWKYDPQAGQFPSTVAVDKVGNVFVTLQALGQVREISPGGEETLFYQFPPGAALFGVAVDAPGNLYVAVTTRGANPALSGVWRITRDRTATRLPGTGAMFLPNGLAFDKQGDLYVTDSYVPGTMPPAGAIWRIPRDGEAGVWLQDSDLLGGLGQLPGAPPVGANGIALDHGVLYVSNTEKGLVLRIPVLLDGSPGDPSVVAQGLPLKTIDGIALDVHGTLYAAVFGPHRIVAVDPATGRITPLAGPADGLDGPTSVSFDTGKGERESIYITNRAFSGLNPAILKMDVGVPGWPLP